MGVVGRRRSTLMDYESAVRVHLVAFFAERPVAKITADDVERFMTTSRLACQSKARRRLAGGGVAEGLRPSGE